MQRLQFCLRSAEAEESVSLSLVDLWPHTGRYHQLRRHMSGFGHCIIGDQRHGCEKANAVAIQADVGMQLAAVQVEIPHEPPDQHATGVSHGSEECKESWVEVCRSECKGGLLHVETGMPAAMTRLVAACVPVSET